MEKNCQQHWSKLNRTLLPGFCLFVASIAHAHPAWLHKKVDGELSSGIILEIDYTTRILKIALTQTSGQTKQEILKLTNETKFAVLVPANLDDILEFTSVKLKGKSADDRRAFLADTLTVLPDWFPAEPGFRETSVAGVFRRSSKGNLFIQAKRRIMQIRNSEEIKAYKFEERQDVALRKGQNVLLVLRKQDGLRVIATAVCVLTQDSGNKP